MKIPVAFFMGGTPEHGKLCCLRKPNYACRMCDIDSNHNDHPKERLWTLQQHSGIEAVYGCWRLQRH